ncbi:MAG: hypothetical protein C0392_11615 [Syntrophus sp. (in: bacteria)]|nr:hypothetical protein [Syntrophus sp. (in: bacteria)]
MAHLVETMIYVGKTPWHGLGTPVPEEKRLNINEAIVAAGLDWEVRLQHIFTENDEHARIGIHNKYTICKQKNDAATVPYGFSVEELLNISIAQQTTFGRRSSGRQKWMM